MIEVLPAYHFLRGMGGGQCLFVCENWYEIEKCRGSREYGVGSTVCENQNIRPEPVLIRFRADVLFTGHIFS